MAKRVERASCRRGKRANDSLATVAIAVRLTYGFVIKTKSKLIDSRFFFLSFRPERPIAYGHLPFLPIKCVNSFLDHLPNDKIIRHFVRRNLNSSPECIVQAASVRTMAI